MKTIDILNFLNDHLGEDDYDGDDAIFALKDADGSIKVKEMCNKNEDDGDRWTLRKVQVLKVYGQKSKPTFFQFTARIPATEEQDCGYTCPSFDIVEPYKKTVTMYRPIKGGLEK